MTKEIICTVCPSSCRLTVSEENGELLITGNGCKRGIEHGVSEYRNPVRMLTATLAIKGGSLPRLPVISMAEVPKALLRDCLEVVYNTQVVAPVNCGDVVISDVCGTGVDIIASRTMKARS